MRIFAPAKLNLFLHVIGRREDGYHALQSLFVPIDYGDTIDLALRDDGDIVRRTTLAGVPAAADLAVRAARALQAAAGIGAGADIAIGKRIPMGAGLGGGSSDAAGVLLALNRLWGLDWPRARLAEIGLALGADVPFFLYGRPALAQGVGEELTAFEVPAWWYLVLTPPVHVPTPFVFGHPDLTRNTPPRKIADFSAAALASTQNDLQAVVLKAFPPVKTHLEALSAVAEKSVFGARMTGSGASVFAAFEREADARNAQQSLPPEMTGFIAKGLVQHSLA